MAKRGRKPRNVKVKNRLGSNRHSRHAYGGPAAHKNAVTEARTRELITNRQLLAWRYFADDGLTFEQIGKKLHVSNCTAFMDCIAVKKALPLVLGHEGIDLLRHRAHRRVSAIIRTYLLKALKGDGDAAHIALKALEREARLIGYDAQREDGFSVDQVASVLRGLRQDIFIHVTDETVRRAIADSLQRRSGMLTGEAIDVKTPPPGNGSSGNGSGGTPV